jgi:hypothetical protein
VSVRYLVADVYDGLATLEDGSVDLVVTSPPFLALRSYLPADHPDKGKEIGSEPTPAEFIDVLLKVTAELRRVLAPHGSIAVELGDTYAGSSGENHLYEGSNPDGGFNGSREFGTLPTPKRGKTGWPLAKSKTLIPELYRIALAYGFNPLTGQPSPAGRWRVRNVVTWCRPNPPVGALGDKWRPATSDVVVACLSGKRYWDDLATRKPVQHPDAWATRAGTKLEADGGNRATLGQYDSSLSSGAPLLDYWEIPPTGYAGAHYAVYPADLVVPLVKAMCPEKVCRTCGEPSRRITEATYSHDASHANGKFDGETYGENAPDLVQPGPQGMQYGRATKHIDTLGWTDCGHGRDWRPGLVLDPFAGSGTTLLVAHGHGYDSIGIDLDSRNLELARERVGPFFFDEVTV